MVVAWANNYEFRVGCFVRLKSPLADNGSLHRLRALRREGSTLVATLSHLAMVGMNKGLSLYRPATSCVKDVPVSDLGSVVVMDTCQKAGQRVFVILRDDL